MASKSEGVVVISEETPRAILVLPDYALLEEINAGRELADHLALATGVELPVTSVSSLDSDLLQIRIGNAADRALDDEIKAVGEDPFAFAIRVQPDGIDLRGLSPEGTRAAAYELLEQLGFRWFHPGEIGRVVPSLSEVSIEPQLTIQSPSFIGRQRARNARNDAWNERVRLGGETRRFGAHGIQPIAGRARSEYFAEHPDYFALINGERVMRQLCLTNSTDDISQNQVLATVVDFYRNFLRNNPDTTILNMGPNDGGGYCECTYCRALDPKEINSPFRKPRPSMTDRYIWFFHQILDQLEDEFPEVKIGFYVYADHMMPPADTSRMDRFVVSLAPIHICRIHGPNNPVCPESQFAEIFIEMWQPLVSDVADRGYLFNLACFGLPFPMMHRLRDEIPLFYERGIRRYLPSPSDNWATHNPSMYLTAKLLWDHEADVDAILNDFYLKYYGPAAEPMRDYHTLMDEAIRDSDHHTGGSWDMPNHYPPAVRKQAREYLQQAEALATGDYSQRVEITRLGFDLLDDYCELMDHRNNFRFDEELEVHDRMVIARDRLMNDFGFPMLYTNHGDRLFERFITRQVRANQETLKGDSIVIAQLEPVWEFKTDEENWGRYAFHTDPRFTGGNWGSIRTDQSWSNQNLRYYFGTTWYRQRVDVGDLPADRPILLWFAGVDSTAEVWVNGEFIGANHGGAEFDLDAYGASFRAFALDATEALKPNETNTIVVRAVRHRTNEVGTGGIVGPVMLYAPDPEME